MRVGIIQGRLSPPTKGFQECPVNWEREFSYFSELQLNHIEWIITKSSFHTNPFFERDLSKYPVHSVCADNLVDERIDDYRFIEENLEPICKSAIKNGIKFVTIPLLEGSSVENDNKRAGFREILKTLTSCYPELNFSLEAELEVTKLIDLLSVSDTVCVTYDTGNITSCGFEHGEYINALADRISNVHLKDRTFQGKTVPPSEGDTNFKLIFEQLKKVNYSNVYTLQTARGAIGHEIETITQHLEILRRLNE
jgi:hexulose-6-phosphate isomerase